ncbi:MAG: response regulator [Chloroflexi bacterium]|nr:response regulator [Chloroflexota bacterium]
MRILYVEDNPANLFLVQRIARMGNHEVLNYPNGESALENFERDRPDLVLMDVQLEGSLTGLDVVRKLRGSGYKTPIVAVTAYAMIGDRERCLEAGCDDYLAKPLPVPRLVELIKRYDPVQPTAAPAAETPKAEAPAPEVPQVEAPKGDAPTAAPEKPAAAPKVEVPAAEAPTVQASPAAAHGAPAPEKPAVEAPAAAETPVSDTKALATPVPTVLAVKTDEAKALLANDTPPPPAPTPPTTPADTQEEKSS